MDYKKRFFSQSYKNALMDYVYMCENSESHAWDRVILTASNEQHIGYKLKLDRNREDYRIIPVLKLLQTIKIKELVQGEQH